MREKIAKIILIFGSCFLIINGIGYLFNNLTFITIIDNPTGGGGRSISNIPTILSFLITCGVLIIGKIKERK